MYVYPSENNPMVFWQNSAKLVSLDFQQNDSPVSQPVSIVLKLLTKHREFRLACKRYILPTRNIA